MHVLKNRNDIKNLILVVVLITFVIGCGKGDDSAQDNSNSNVLLYSELQWDALNPARGDNSPKAANLWGDRNTKNATGFLVKFKEGFSSPPHIHNVTYRAIVLEGLIHNDDPNAEKNWMTVGSYWTQESGESHITEAKSKNNIAYVEIDSGPYLVEPISNAYDNGSNSLNINSSNLVWLDNTESKIIKSNSDVEISNIWQNKENNTYGVFIKLPPKYDGMLKSSGSELLS